MNNIIETVAKGFLRKSFIIHKEQISKSVYHIRIQSKSLKNVSYQPGYFVRIFCETNKDIGHREKYRSYSVWNFNRPEQTIDIAVNTHSGGLGANWARLCQAGDTVYFSWEKSELTIDHKKNKYLLIGDLSTLAHYYEINRHLPPDKNVDSLIYFENKSDLFPDIDGRTPLNFHQLSDNPTDLIIGKLSAFFHNPDGNPIAYIGGDIRVCLSVYRYFRHELQKDMRQIRIKPFWGPTMRALK